MKTSKIVEEMRLRSGLSYRNLGKRADLATSTIIRIENDQLNPTLETLQALAVATGNILEINFKPDYSKSIIGLSNSIREDLQNGSVGNIVRKVGEFSYNVINASRNNSLKMLVDEPSSTLSKEWDVFLAALCEWLSNKSNLVVPKWCLLKKNFLDHGWWVSSFEKLKAIEYAKTPIEFKYRGIYIDVDELVNV